MRDAETTSEFIKACCSGIYGSELVHLLLGGRLHPGGEELTRRLADLTCMGPGDRVLDVASGRGATARLLAAERGVTVHGVELSPRLVKLAERETAEAGLDDRASFEIGDAERLPADASFDVVLCECALCTFPDQAAAAAGFRRVLAPGGRVGIADVTLQRERLPAELDTPIGRVACIAGALPVSGYARLLGTSGFADVAVEPRPDAALATVDHIREWLGAAGEPLRGLFDLGEVLRLVDLARRCVLDGVLGYALITASVPEDAGDADELAGAGRADGPLR